MGAQVEVRALADRRRVEPVGRAEHARGEAADGLERRAGAPQQLERRQRLPAQLADDLVDAVVAGDGAAAEPALEVVGVRAGDARVRRAEEAEEVAAAAALPLEREQAEQGLAERRPVEPQAALERVRDPEAAEHGLDGAAEPVERRDDEGDPLRRRARTEQGEQLVGDELERPARARALEEADRALERGGCRRGLREERALELRQGGMREGLVGGRQLLDPALRERREVVGGAAQAREGGPPGLVRERDGHLRPAGEGLEQAPFGGRQVLEAVGEDRSAVPGVELVRDPLGRAPLAQPAVGAPEPLELVPVGAVEPPELAADRVGREQPGVELGERLQERLREAGEAGGAAEPVQARLLEDAADEQRALDVAEHGRAVGARACQPLEQVREGADPAAEERSRVGEQVALHPVDVRPVRHDQHRPLLEPGAVALQQQRDLARVRGPGDQRQPHSRPMVVRWSDGSRSAESGKARKLRVSSRAAARTGCRAPGPPRRGNRHEIVTFRCANER